MTERIAVTAGKGLSRLAALLVATLLPVACIYDYGTDCPDEGERTALTLSTGIVDAATRAGADLSLTSGEKMQSLRIVILHEDGTVEHNRFASLSEATEHHDVFLVTKGETKKIYLIANEGSISGLSLDGFGTDAEGFEAAVQDFSFTADYSKPIPMSACYEVAVDTLRGRTKQMCVVRTATKFTFSFVNKRENAVTVSDLSLSDVVNDGGSTYLLPHFVDGNGETVASEKFSVTKGAYDASGTFWIDWLKYVVDRSNADPTNTALADVDGWLTGYTVPSAAEHSVYTHSGTLEIPAYTDGTAGEASMEPFYLCESRYVGEDGSQQYSVSMTLKDSDGAELRYSGALPNLKALFRNTHVTVTATLYDSKVELKYQAQPWTTGGGEFTFD